MASPRTDKAVVEKVRKAFVEMANDVRGQQILRASADVLKQKENIVFLPASDKDYENYRNFYRTTVIVD
jgi:phosphonate transport system substrate-binding protein